MVGTPLANRSRPELEGLIGYFVNSVALRADLAGALPICQPWLLCCAPTLRRTQVLLVVYVVGRLICQLLICMVISLHSILFC